MSLYESDAETPEIASPSVAVLRDLAAMPIRVQRTTEAATAFALAEELERGRALSASAVAKELVALMDKLRGMASAVEKERDPLDELTSRRVARLADAAGH
jgi:hypothetical protein